MKLKPIVHAILSAYPLPIHGDHGGGHWARVLENGIRLSSTTKANIAVISLFAVFHDSCQQNECGDPELGLRGAEVAKKVSAQLFDLSNDEFQLLYVPCEDTHVNALILASRFRPVGTLIDSIWGGSVLRRIQVGLVPMRPD